MKTIYSLLRLYTLCQDYIFSTVNIICSLLILIMVFTLNLPPRHSSETLTYHFMFFVFKLFADECNNKINHMYVYSYIRYKLMLQINWKMWLQRKLHLWKRYFMVNYCVQVTYGVSVEVSNWYLCLITMFVRRVLPCFSKCFSCHW